ncbi:PDR/VanB family oxidoreductase [Streptomyces erythrochromogenes]|uniref:PDR/VanB family oxidoreductase n=1 Tax=Streptomyces erythrochromogenes TaxID=285574 RepID=UPI0036A9EFF6
MSTFEYLDAVVHAITQASASGGCRTFELRPADSGAFPSFDAGAHIDVHLRPSLIRQYSLLGSPHDRSRYLICVRRDPRGRGGSIAMHQEVAVGQQLRISAPRNRFPLAAAARYVLIAGGIGITPLLAMADTLTRQHAEFALHHYASTQAEAPLLEELKASDYSDRVTLHYDDVDGGIRAELPAELSAPDPQAAVYLCGPGGFMNHVINEAVAVGWRYDQLHTERFAPAPPSPAQLGIDGSARAQFAVRVARTGLTYQVPADQSIAEVLVANGVDIKLSCQQGLCGTCLTPVLAGEPDHRDEVLTPAERASNDRIAICCSRSRSPELLLGL